MSFLDLAKSRYTTKSYNPNKRISEETIAELKEILSLSPSSINSQPWKFIFISDEKLKSELAGVSYFNQQKINDASHLVVFSVIDDIQLFENQIRQNLPEGSVNYYNQFLKPKPESEIKSWLEHQVYLSLGFFLSACASMDIDSSPMEGIKNEEYDKILQLDGYKSLFAVAIGYRNPEDFNQPSVKAKSRLSLEQTIQSF
ncbi:nitroreductase family protein [Flavobacterium lindanitolerans]|uniref:Nitroreductase/dihydropteridine reductase n=1 Tax=Flavobacterium lindanitolerans TaxID=428988 RepID=A0A497VDT8_9FLAO|nr:nitroreductase family protein [Flavobacterium lindanitolerans]PKW29636.1 nitroreductase/dihydropteridine reductase [Flavobacterium lindanitolerans]RLJ34863.1 nitroreductase/dihydropteridine reductase [Flavobacterium lindanitolerans]